MNTNFLYQIENFKIYEKAKIGQAEYPVIALHETGIYVFLDDSLTEDTINKKIYPLQQALSCSRIKMNIYGKGADGIMFLDPFSDNVYLIDSLSDHVRERCATGFKYLDSTQYEILNDKLTFSNSHKGSDIRTDTSGQRYIKRGSYWYPVSSDDTDEIFSSAAKFGWSGWFHFNRKKTGMGILYFLSAGLLGVGVLMDLLLLMFGYAKDEEGFYYAPVSDKKHAFKMLLLALVINGVVDVIYVLLYGIINSGIASIIATLAT